MTSGKFSYGLSISMSGQPAFRKRTGGGVLVMTADAVSRIVIEGTLRRMGIACRSLDMAALAPVADGEMPDLVILDCTRAADLCRRHAGGGKHDDACGDGVGRAGTSAACRRSLTGELPAAPQSRTSRRSQPRRHPCPPRRRPT